MNEALHIQIDFFPSKRKNGLMQRLISESIKHCKICLQCFIPSEKSGRPKTQIQGNFTVDSLLECLAWERTDDAIYQSTMIIN